MGLNYTRGVKFGEEVVRIGTTVTKQEVSNFMRWLATEAFTRIGRRTPIDTGVLIGNLRIAKSLGSENTLKRRGLAVQTELSKLLFINPFSIITIYNNIPYGEYWEYGTYQPANPGPSKDPRPGRKGKILVRDGFSVQSPQGMFNITFAELVNTVRVI